MKPIEIGDVVVLLDTDSRPFLVRVVGERPTPNFKRHIVENYGPVGYEQYGKIQSQLESIYQKRLVAMANVEADFLSQIQKVEL